MIKLGIIMDPIQSINIKKDTSFAILLEAKKRNFKIYYMEINDLFLYDGVPFAKTRLLNVYKDYKKWYKLDKVMEIKLSELNVILMRKDPPVNENFIYATYILETAERFGTKVINNPKSLRDCNEKFYPATFFSKFLPETLITTNKEKIYDFWKKNKNIILKPLNGMGGKSIFHIQSDISNLSVIIEHLTDYESQYCMVQQYIPEIKTEGDKRILMIDGEPIPYCLARIPKKGESRGNLMAGGQAKGLKLGKTEIKIAKKIGPFLKEKGLIFVGLDIIGNKLTEINITSPTCVCEIENIFSFSVTNILMNKIENLLK
ncbi:glutathione synthase [Candidatus Tachikawaea gelatinosa]|uniref:Glutathione synthetase n=1 Tax=Candidatus Tachikawaea gelatinosa TaxID=1410383 RepID=A0A090ASI5_9ENTR|nr:glutathione synthase [Candidatus Tachikawaea gelatinosa]BAP58840.1 glutathione synthetase [Candidatus Tachikawaea gelatinosa]